MAKKSRETKSYASQETFETFNKRQVKKTASGVLDTLKEETTKTFMKYDIPAPKLWVTIENISASLEDAWDYAPPDHHFRRWWLDRLVAEFGLLIWNEIYSVSRQTKDDKKSDRLAEEGSSSFKRLFS